jgi:N utilization substance protein A
VNGEKIDIIQWSPDQAQFVANALSPVKPLKVELREDDHTALVTVPERQLSLAIGKEGQNARLAAKLTGWRIDVIRPDEAHAQEAQPVVAASADPDEE